MRYVRRVDGRDVRGEQYDGSPQSLIKICFTFGVMYHWLFDGKIRLFGRYVLGSGIVSPGQWVVNWDGAILVLSDAIFRENYRPLYRE